MELLYASGGRKLGRSQGSYFVLHVSELLTVRLYVSVFVCRCGYATLHDVKDKTQEDRMESFFLSETSKYLYLVSITGKLSSPAMQFVNRLSIFCRLVRPSMDL